MLTAGLLAGCSGGGAQEAAGQPSTAPSVAGPSVQPAPTCAPVPTPITWPSSVPADLPKPPAATLTDVEARPDGLTVVKFSTASSLRSSVVFLVQALPKAGYTLARGDAEATEADVPFVKGDLRGVLRMLAVEPCRTDWLMALAKGRSTAGPSGGSPLLPPRPGSSPLPFG